MPPPEWRISQNPIAYDQAITAMEARIGQIHESKASELIWLLEHPPLYTAGANADPADLIDPDRFPVHQTGRGGQYTYHGPGQRIAYVMLDLKERSRDIRKFVYDLEEWIIRTLGLFDITGERRDGRIGIWVPRPEKGAGQEDKIAAIGIRVRRWVSFHGLAININPDLGHYSGIIPCGVPDHGVTSFADLGVSATMDEVDQALKQTFNQLFNTENA